MESVEFNSLGIIMVNSYKKIVKLSIEAEIKGYSRERLVVVRKTISRDFLAICTEEWSAPPSVGGALQHFQQMIF